MSAETILPGFRITAHDEHDGPPHQAYGRVGDGRPFYWRAKNGSWELAVGDPSWPTDVAAWPASATGRWVASGEYPLARDADWLAPLGIGIALSALALVLGAPDPRSLTGALVDGVILDAATDEIPGVLPVAWPVSARPRRHHGLRRVEISTNERVRTDPFTPRAGQS